MSNISLNSTLTEALGIGTYYAKLLSKLGLRNVEDLLRHFPSRYLDFSVHKKVAELIVGDAVTLDGQLTKLQPVITRYGRSFLKGVFRDATGLLNLIWFNQPYLKNSLPLEENLSLSGTVEANDNRLVMINPVVEQGTGATHTGGLIPIYPETKGLYSKWLRARIKFLLEALKSEINNSEYLPKDLTERFNFPNLFESFKNVHFPKDNQEAETARRRFAFEELFFLHLATIKRRQEWGRKKTPVKISNALQKVQPFLSSLPFTLTFSQKTSLDEIISDFKKETPGNRLLQGDVGSGKTIVALAAAYTLFTVNYRSIYMAPTEILAKQHFATAEKFLTPFGLKIHLLTGTSEKKSLKDLKDYDLLIGTHALLYRPLPKDRLGLIIIDEQHRFGVEQRGKLLDETTGPTYPHLLTMTATPIPRTLALTLYGDLDLSQISELPPGRIPIKTWVVPPEKREAAYEWIKKQLGQAFIVCPFIEESEVETLKSVKAAVTEFNFLKEKVFTGYQLGLLHGRLKPAEKEEVMRSFREKKLDVLVATPVVEVGIDIPSASIIVVEGANHFGLASLHQLRGRVGRGDRQSYCLLFSDSREPQVMERLKQMEKYSNGQQLSEADLRFRGAGQIFGTAQHGFLRLKVADLYDYPLIKTTGEVAKEFYSQGLENYPKLAKKAKEEHDQIIKPN